MKFRIKYIEGKGYFPQVRLYLLYPWQTICLLPNNDYILRPEHWDENLKQQKREAWSVCKKYLDIVNNMTNPKYSEIKDEKEMRET